MSTVRGYLEFLNFNGMMYKYRNRILIISADDWMLPQEEWARISWDGVKRLRETVGAANGLLPVREALVTLGKARREQIPGLVLEVPELGNLVVLYPLLRHISGNRLALNSLLGRTGLPLDDDVRRALEPFRFPDVPEAIAFYVEEGPSDIPIPGFDKGRMITFGYVLKNKVRRPLVDVPRLPNTRPSQPAGMDVSADAAPSTP